MTSHLTMMIYLDIYTWLAILAFSAAELKEYCLREKLEAKCGSNEVIVMQSARYGRLRLGHCVQKDFGFIGCAVDVLTITERACSGHQQCTIDVFKTFGNLRPCSELEAFLEADYACLPVIEVSARHCLPSGSEPITTDLGYISSLSTTRASHLGQRSCTLTLRAKPGQRWNISLVDFSVPGHLVSGTSSGQLPPAETDAAVSDGDAVMDDRLPVCQRYAVIRDEKLSTGSVICGGGSAREKLVHLSTSHVIQVDVFGRGADPAAQYLFRIEAIGCPDLETPNVVVVWKDADRMQLRCNSSGQLHQMTCVDKRWTGDIGISCDKERSRSIWQIIQQDWTSKPAYGILLMTLLGVILGIIIGCSMLAISVLCHRRKIKSQSAQSSAVEIHKTLLMRKSVDMMSSSSRNASQSAADTSSSSAEYAARALWRETTAPRIGGVGRLDEYFIPHKYSLRTTVATEADNGPDPFAGDRQAATDPGVDGSGEDGCRYHACLQRAVAAAVAATGGPETEIGVGKSYSACVDAAAANPQLQPMYSESSGYGNSTVSLSTMEHIYEIPE